MYQLCVTLGILIVVALAHNWKSFSLNQLQVYAFGDGAQSKIEGVGTIVIDGLPLLNYMLFVADLKENLIKVGQLCDDDLMVMFKKHSCKVLKHDGNCVFAWC